MLDWPELRDVLIHVVGGEGQLWFDYGGRLRQLPEWRASPEAVRAMAVGLIAAGGRHLDELNPCADVRLGDDQTGESGMGIGLTMSRSYVEQMGGTLELESTVGEGTTAVMTLPVSLAV